LVNGEANRAIKETGKKTGKKKTQGNRVFKV